jgi:lipoprotein-anchoring transpeptidase ErfK/SrfK
VRIRQIVLGVAAVAVAGVLAACSSGTSAQSGAGTSVQLAAGNAGSTAATSTTTTAPSTTTATSTTTSTTQPTTTTVPPTTRHTVTTQAAPANPPAYAAGVPCHITTGACADLSTHKAWIVRDGQVVYGPVSALGGKSSYPTPAGTFHVLSKSKNYFSKEFQAPMPYAVFFYPGDAFHVGSLSTPSHGCIHLSRSAAQTFFADLQVGETVQIIK